MLQNEGVKSQIDIGEGMNHVYPIYPIPEAKEALQEICDIITAK